MRNLEKVYEYIFVLSPECFRAELCYYPGLVLVLGALMNFIKALCKKGLIIIFTGMYLFVYEPHEFFKERRGIVIGFSLMFMTNQLMSPQSWIFVRISTGIKQTALAINTLDLITLISDSLKVQNKLKLIK